jgi:chitinase
MAENTTSAVKQLSDGRDEGTSLGQSVTDKISFYNVTPVDQPAHASQAAVTMSSTKTTTQLRADLDATADLANQLRAALVSLGGIKGSA